MTTYPQWFDRDMFISGLDKQLGTDLEGLFSWSGQNLSTTWSALANFYGGLSGELPTTEEETVKVKLAELSEIFRQVGLQPHKLQGDQAFVLLADLDDLEEQLLTCLNTPKWVNSDHLSIESIYTQEQARPLSEGETLEQVARRFGLLDPDEDWQLVASDSNLREDDYLGEGGELVTLQKIKNPKAFPMSTVVAVIKGKAAYGLDLPVSLSYVDNDLKVLTPDETIRQSFKILLGLTKGKNPHFPEDGMDKRLLIGQADAQLSMPVILRQLMETLATDDSIINPQVENVEFTSDQVYITVQAYTVLGEELVETTD